MPSSFDAMPSSELVHRIGQLWGRYVLRHILRGYHRRCATFALTVTGAEHLRAACPRPYLLVANHVVPHPEEVMINRLLPDTYLTLLPNRVLHLIASSHCMLLFNCPSDSFILAQIVQEETERCLRVVARSNWGTWSPRPTRRLFQERVTHPFGNGLREGLGYIPFDHTGRFQREFLQSVEGALGRAEPVLIFPGKLVPDEVLWIRDSLPEGGIYPGAAHLARRYGLPILPAYIAGAQSWRAGQAASVTFGPAFECDGMSKKEICCQIIERIQACKHLPSADSSPSAAFSATRQSPPASGRVSNSDTSGSEKIDNSRIEAKSAVR